MDRETYRSRRSKRGQSVRLVEALISAPDPALEEYFLGNGWEDMSLVMAVVGWCFQGGSLWESASLRMALVSAPDPYVRLAM
jgi:hypothetical protein